MFGQLFLICAQLTPRSCKEEIQGVHERPETACDATTFVHI